MWECAYLDLSKMQMYEFHFNYIKRRHGEKVKLLFTNTGSLCYEIEADNIYRDFFLTKTRGSITRTTHQITNTTQTHIRIISVR